MDAGLTELIDRLSAAVEEPTPEAITRRVKADLEDLLGRGSLDLPARFTTPRSDCYARRLLHQDPRNRFTAVVMTWGPGQGTPVHDHGGLWCVEGVVEGQMEVTQYDVQPEGDAFRVRPVGPALTAGVGTAGRLIPPTDYHVLANANPDATSITLHVYGGSLDGCRIFTPRADGRYVESVRALSYHD
ncbi:MAG TPA: cysteine dioxygenase family protein [Vicinamibacterales bacterium]|nr:cysteine dioxygenase family protein [Vicinamibacterales bacterium]